MNSCRTVRSVVRARTLRHAALAAIVLVTTGLFVRFGSGDRLDNLSLATAWLCLILMAVALSLGPLRVLQTNTPAINLQQRRDIGIWAALAGLAHLVAATAQSMSEQYMAIYVYISQGGIAATTRAGLYAWGSVIGLLIGVVLLLLLGLSNNRVMNRLGPKRWKRLQRLAYPAFALTAVHGVMFQLLEFRSQFLVGILVLITGVLVWLQLLGIRAVRKGR